MKKRFVCLVLALLLAALPACALGGTGVTVWRAVSPYYLEDGAAVESEVISVDSSLSVIDAAVAAFNSDTEGVELLRAMPQGIDILGWEISDGVLDLETSPEYATLTGYWRTVADCCVALTFCAIDGVESVSLYSQGTALSLYMTPGEFLLEDASGTEE